MAGRSYKAQNAAQAFKAFVYVLIELFVFLLLSCKTSLHIVDKSHLLENIFQLFSPILLLAF